MIPKVVHRISLGSASSPPRFSDAAVQWPKCFPDYELMLWHNKNMADLQLPSLWFSAKIYAEQADIARYWEQQLAGRQLFQNDDGVMDGG